MFIVQNIFWEESTGHKTTKSCIWREKIRKSWKVIVSDSLGDSVGPDSRTACMYSRPTRLRSILTRLRSILTRLRSILTRLRSILTRSRASQYWEVFCHAAGWCPDEANWNLGWAERFSWSTDSLDSVSYKPGRRPKWKSGDLAWGRPNWRQLDAVTGIHPSCKTVVSSSNLKV